MSELNAAHSLLHKLHVDCHEFSDESLQVVDGLVAPVETMLIFGSQVSNLHLQLAVTILDELL